MQVLPTLGTGGVERGTVDMAKAIVRCNGVALVVSSGGEAWKEILKKSGIIHITLPLNSKNPFKIWKNQFVLKKIITTFKVDIVHARSRAPAWSCWFACKKTQTSFITTWHGVYNENFQLKRCYNQVMAKGHRVIAISHFIAKRLRDRYHVDRSRLRIIPRSVDTHIFNVNHSIGERVGKLAFQWNIPEDKKIIMLPARLSAWKGHELLLRAFARICNPESWVCVFVGPEKPKQNLSKQLRKIAATLNIMDRVYFVGDCQDMPAAFALANIVVIPSLKPEPFGRVVIEAQAMGKPVLVANHGGACETVTHEQTGFVFEAGNLSSLSYVLNALTEMSENDLQWIGRRAQEMVKEKYDVKLMQRATLKVYNEVLTQEKQFDLHAFE